MRRTPCTILSGDYTILSGDYTTLSGGDQLVPALSGDFRVRIFGLKFRGDFFASILDFESGDHLVLVFTFGELDFGLRISGDFLVLVRRIRTECGDSELSSVA